jgi:YVTN family beta-propeller protein
VNALRPLLLVFAVWGAAAPLSAETLLVVRKSDAALDFIDPGSGLRLASVAVGHAPHEVSVSPDGRLAAVSNYGTQERPGTTVSIVDLEQAQELRRIELAPHTRPHGVAWYAPERLAVTVEGSQRLLIADPLSGRILSAIETGQERSHMVAVNREGNRAYVTNMGSGTTTAIDLVSGRKLADIPTGSGSEAIALTPDGRELWVAARTNGEIAIADTATLTVTARLPLPGLPIRLAFTRDGATALVTCAGTSELVAFDVAARRERARRRIEVSPVPGAGERPLARLAPGSALPIGLLVSPEGNGVYVAATMGDRILHFDATTFAPIRAIEVDGEPDGLGTTSVMPRAVCHACTTSSPAD